MDTLEVCPNTSGNGVSPKVKKIAESLRFKMKACILTQPNKVCEIFNITKKELKEFKDNFFNIDSIVEMGKPFLVGYLEETNQKSLLQYYLNGADYTNYKLGLSSVKSNDQLYSNLTVDTLTACLDTEDIDLKIKALRTIKVENESENILDKLGQKLKEQGIDL